MYVYETPEDIGFVAAILRTYVFLEHMLHYQLTIMQSH